MESLEKELMYSLIAKSKNGINAGSIYFDALSDKDAHEKGLEFFTNYFLCCKDVECGFLFKMEYSGHPLRVFSSEQWLETFWRDG